MNKKCHGCGAIMQCEDKEKLGYTPDFKIETSDYCERCFKIMHYNLKEVTKLDNINSHIIEEVNKKAKYVYFLIDFLNINSETIATFKSINAPKTLIISKIDIIPKSIKENVITNWMSNTYKIEDEILYQSTKKNINTKSLLRNLENQNIKECYILGFTNAGKSTLINKICSINDINNREIATSLIPNTTVDFINIDLKEGIKIIDSPGFTHNTTIYDENEFDLIKKVTPKSTIKPITYQVKEISSILIEGKIRIKSNIKNSLTFYMSNDLIIDRVFDNNQKMIDKNKIILSIPSNSDLVIKSVGFINIKNACELEINADNLELFEIRKSMFRD